MFQDQTPVQPHHHRLVLKRSIKFSGLDPNIYDCRSLRAGRAVNMFKDNMEIETIKKLGRWKSNAVYDYLKEA